MKKKICIFTGTRAEYGLLKPLIDELKVEKSIELQLIVSGMHLSPEFGFTVREIDKSPFTTVKEIEILLSSDTAIGISKAIGLAFISFAEAYEKLQPNILIGLGDRFELFSAVSVANILNIPIAHISGGEITYGAFDEGFRHAITKMSHLHFTSTEHYRRRVIQMGEDPKTVFNVGALGIDNIKNMKLLSKSELEKELSFRLNKPYFVITFHPVTKEKYKSISTIKNLLSALDEFKNYKIIFTKSNADNEGRAINKIIEQYVSENRQRAIAFTSLGQLRYLSLLKYSAMMLGNSSSGIIEMPYFKKPTINIGDRQKGRIFPFTVVQSKETKIAIINSIKKASTSEFLKKCKSYKNIYGNGTAAKKIRKVLFNTDFDKLQRKEFFDIEF